MHNNTRLNHHTRDAPLAQNSLFSVATTQTAACASDDQQQNHNHNFIVAFETTPDATTLAQQQRVNSDDRSRALKALSFPPPPQRTTTTSATVQVGKHREDSTASVVQPLLKIHSRDFDMASNYQYESVLDQFSNAL